MKWLVLFLALSACSTARQECDRLYPEPVSGASIGATTGGASSGIVGGIIGGLISAAIDDSNPEHQKWEKEDDQCLKQKKE